jgi:hypothetical protein
MKREKGHQRNSSAQNFEQREKEREGVDHKEEGKKNLTEGKARKKWSQKKDREKTERTGGKHEKEKTED